MKRLASYLSGEFQTGKDGFRSLVNPTTEETLAEASSEGLDLEKALAFAREQGGPALRELTFKQRAELLRGLASAMHDIREELIDLAIQNGGNTRGDAKFDIDGASFTLSAYADLGESLGDTLVLTDGEPIQVGRTARLSGQHVFLPRRGVAVHINAFNFPAWGLAEKAAAALMAGMPVLSKPATATALVAHRMVEVFAERNLLPAGALSLLCGSAGSLLDHLTHQDVVAFTGSSETARSIRRHDSVIDRSVAVNIEADSLNAAAIGPGTSLTDETGGLFLADVARDMTQKTGQKCTAIRRILVPKDMVDDVVDALRERLDAIKVGDPSDSNTRMGPLATATQHRDIRAGIDALCKETRDGYGGDGTTLPAELQKGFFTTPVLRIADNATSSAVHEREVFGPVATILPYGSQEELHEAIALGGGGLVTSLYSDDRDFLTETVHAAAPFHGRLYLGSEKIAAQSPGPGTVLPTLLHGGPGRAGGGEELGGERGMQFYMQRTALQGDKSILAAICKTP